MNSKKIIKKNKKMEMHLAIFTLIGFFIFIALPIFLKSYYSQNLNTIASQILNHNKNSKINFREDINTMILTIFD